MSKSFPGSTQSTGSTLGEDCRLYQIVGIIVFIALISFVFRDRPAAFPVNVTAIDDTKNFDEFPEVELNFSKFLDLSCLQG